MSLQNETESAIDNVTSTAPGPSTALITVQSTSTVLPPQNNTGPRSCRGGNETTSGQPPTGPVTGAPTERPTTSNHPVTTTSTTAAPEPGPAPPNTWRPYFLLFGLLVAIVLFIIGLLLGCLGGRCTSQDEGEEGFSLQSFS